jgi:hypothetical protein
VAAISLAWILTDARDRLIVDWKDLTHTQRNTLSRGLIRMFWCFFLSLALVVTTMSNLAVAVRGLL